MIKALKQLYVSFTNWMVRGIPPDDLTEDVCVLRLDELGDFVLWLDSAKELRKMFPGRHIVLWVNKKWFDLANSLPYWDSIVGIDTKRFRFDFFYRLMVLKMMRHRGYSTVICPRHSIQFLLEPGLVAVSAAEERIVYEGNFPILKTNYYTASVPCRPIQLHELIRNADFVRNWLPDFKSTVSSLNYEHPPLVINNLVVICPKSLRKRKEWPYMNFVDLGDKIHDEFESNIVICNDKEIPVAETTWVLNLSGKTSLMDFISIIAKARLVISNDSSAIHIAAALNVPSVCIGSERYGRFMPYKVDVARPGMVLPKLVYREHVSDITVDEVWKTVQEVLNGH